MLLKTQSNKMMKYLLLAVFTVASFSAFAQTNPILSCGTVHDTETLQLMNERAAATRAFMKDNPTENRDDNITYLPIKYHIISRTNSNTAVPDHKVYEMHCFLNQEYAALDIQFYINDGFNRIENNNAYENPSDVPFVMNQNKVNNAINVYIGKNSTPPNGSGLGTTLGYYSPSNDWIVIRKDEVSDVSSTFNHEMGHFLSLPHPFNGWDCTYWEEWKEENPNADCAPQTAPCEFIPVELGDGSNCATAGDFICDTPADYNFGFANGNNCFMTHGNACDWNGAELDPMANNYMSYFEGCAQYEFTPMQGAQMIANSESPARNYLMTDGGPQSTAELAAPALVSPADGDTPEFYNSVYLDWDFVPGATRYLVQVALSDNFSTGLQNYYSYNSEILIGDLNPNVGGNFQYHWRVMPLNELSTCNFSGSRSFSTNSATTSVQNLSTVSSFNVVPNPVAAGTSFNIDLTVSETLTADIQVINLQGQVLVSETAQNFNQGENTLHISAARLSAGLYFVRVSSEQGVVTRRVVVAQ